jgi:protein tyrosine kinase modulator
MNAYLEAPLRRPWHALVPLAVCSALALAASYAIPKRYTSSTTILVEAEKAPELLGSGGEETAQRLPTLRQELLSRTRLERVLHELDPYPDAVGRRPLSQVIDQMRSAIRINVKGDDAFTIEFTHRDPHMAMAVANRLASLFIEESSHAREERAEGTTDFIESELTQARAALDGQEEKIRVFKEQHLGSLPEQLPANLATLQRLELEQQGLAEDLGATLKRLSALETTPSAAPAAPGAAAPRDPALELAQLKTQLASLQNRYTDAHPEVRALKARIAQLEGAGLPDREPAPASGGGDALRRARAEIQSRQARQKGVARQLAEYEARVAATPRTEAELSTLTRDHQQLKDRYLSLLNKKMGARMNQTLEERWKGQVFRVLDPAHLPDRAAFPNRLAFLAGGIALGLLVGLGLAVGAEGVDVSVKSADDLAPLALPLLGVVRHLDLPKATLAGGEAAPPPPVPPRRARPKKKPIADYRP